MSTIGILGAGHIGGAIATRLGAKSIQATIANSRGPQSLRDLVAKAGPSLTAGTREEAASKDIVFVAVKWLKLQSALSGLPDWAPGARVVKAFNHHYYLNLEKDPGAEGGRRVLFYAGDDEATKKEVASLIERLGFFGIDMGDIEHGSRLFQSPDGPLIAHDLVKIG